MFLPVLHVLARLSALFCVALLLPLGVGLAFGENGLHEILAFVVPAAVAFAFSLGTRLLIREPKPLQTTAQGLLAVAIGWVLHSALGAFPFWLSGALPRYVDAFFETMSGFTTTGASVFTDLEAVPRGLLFWRAQTQFMGGLGIIALFVAILPALGGGMLLFRSEASSSLLDERLRPRIQDTAKLILIVYVGLCVASAAAFWLAGLSPFDAVCHAFSALSTGGFSTRNASLGAFSPAAQWVAVASMLVGALPFALLAKAVQGRPKDLFTSDEVLLFLAVIVLGIVVTFAILSAGPSPLLLNEQPAGAATGVEERLRAVVVNVVSCATTTGYATANFDGWPSMARLLLILLVFVGGCSASTAGGLKQIRVLLFARALGRHVSTLLHPSRVITIRLGQQPVSGQAVLMAMLLLLTYLLVVTVSALLVTATGVDVTEAFTGSIACITSNGPGLGTVGPAGNYADLPAFAKLVLSAVMLMGRLEIVTILALFSLLRPRR